MVGPASRIPGLEVDLFLYLFVLYFPVRLLVPDLLVVLPLVVSRADGTQGVVGSWVEPAKLLVGGVPGEHLLLVLFLIEIVKFEPGGRFLGNLSVLGSLVVIDDEAASGPDRLQIAPRSSLCTILVH